MTGVRVALYNSTYTYRKWALVAAGGALDKPDSLRD
jgi:hypothetical protein